MPKWTKADRARIAAARVRKLAGELQDEADNLSPSNTAHPAPLLHSWKHRLYSVAELLEKTHG
jgi:hypothetical protein